ncbi:MAG: MBL fold metallo-hydrolase [Candidatus Pacebacteria bacterium]|nr:MBL fold metallo-hydrolase [Candidatus Paceibacterota bacterium]
MQKKKVILIFLGILAMLNILAWIAVLDLSGQKFLEVTFFDVGQGDSSFIETPNGFQILIDGGPSSKVLEKLGKKMPFWDRSIDLIISSHPDPDHLLGLIDVSKNYKVGAVVTNGTVSSRPEFLEFKNLLEKNKVPLIVLKKNNQILIGENLYFKILAPLEDFEGREVADFNSSSIVAKMGYYKSAFLFMGDTPKSVEEDLVLEDGALLDSDVLKVAHHGSKTAKSEIFYETVSPKFAIIQVGLNNQYGHPHQEVLEALAKYGIYTMRTDQEGDIKIISDGENLKILSNNKTF